MTINKELIEKIALKVTRTGTDKINFRILGMLPSDINTMMKELNLTKVPVNSRMNQLEKVGLVKRWRGTGRIVLTDLGEDFLELIDDYQNIVRFNIMDMLKKMSDS